jgi:hypothetical protein
LNSVILLVISEPHLAQRLLYSGTLLSYKYKSKVFDDECKVIFFSFFVNDEQTGTVLLVESIPQTSIKGLFEEFVLQVASVISTSGYLAAIFKL